MIDDWNMSVTESEIEAAWELVTVPAGPARSMIDFPWHHHFLCSCDMEIPPWIGIGLKSSFLCRSEPVSISELICAVRNGWIKRGAPDECGRRMQAAPYSVAEWLPMHISRHIFSGSFKALHVFIWQKCAAYVRQHCLSVLEQVSMTVKRAQLQDLGCCYGLVTGLVLQFRAKL